MGRPIPEAGLFSPTRALLILLRGVRRRWRCNHPGWVPFDGCPDCGKPSW